jgi:DNA-binding transcriptional regulator YiaG
MLRPAKCLRDCCAHESEAHQWHIHVIAPRKLWKQFLNLARAPDNASAAADVIHAQVADVDGTHARMSNADAQMAESLSSGLKRLGMTQSDFADICEVTPKTVSNWVRGKTDVNPMAWVLLEILENYPDVRRDFVCALKGRPRGKPFEPGNPFRFGDRRRSVCVAAAHIGRAVRSKGR